jgi:hypothetical protein
MVAQGSAVLTAPAIVVLIVRGFQDVAQFVSGAARVPLVGPPGVHPRRVPSTGGPSRPSPGTARAHPGMREHATLTMKTRPEFA